MNLDTISEERLLSHRICELPVQIAGTWLEECVAQLHHELDARGIAYKPRCYLAEEWLTPEHEPVIGIPFFLAHPTLMRLEKKMMLEVEGETRDWCMQLLRHEAGHAIGYAYQLNNMRAWQRMFGSSSEAYEDTYKFMPYSKSYVRHLPLYYAQHHPDEDYAETFAVWLTPGLDWSTQYKGWKALEKLRFVDRMMRGVRGKPPRVKTGKPRWHIQRLRSTLRNHYKKKRHAQSEDFPDFHDPNLRKIFAERDVSNASYPTAVQIISRHRKSMLRIIAKWTGERQYIVNDLLKLIYQRCKELRLVAVEPEPEALLRLSTYITSLIMNYRYTGWFRGE